MRFGKEERKYPAAAAQVKDVVGLVARDATDNFHKINEVAFGGRQPHLSQRKNGCIKLLDLNSLLFVLFLSGLGTDLKQRFKSEEMLVFSLQASDEEKLISQIGFNSPFHVKDFASSFAFFKGVLIVGLQLFGDCRDLLLSVDFRHAIWNDVDCGLFEDCRRCVREMGVDERRRRLFGDEEFIVARGYLKEVLKRFDGARLWLYKFALGYLAG